MVDNVSYEYMCFFLAGGLRTSEGNFLLRWRVACGLVEAGVHVERRRSGLQLQLPSGLKVYGACVLRGVYLSCDRKFGEKLQCSFMVYSRFCSQSKGRCFSAQKYYFLVFSHVVFDTLINSVLGISVSRVLLGEVGSRRFPFWAEVSLLCEGRVCLLKVFQ